MASPSTETPTPDPPSNEEKTGPSAEDVIRKSDDDGLYQACMDSIRSAHMEAGRLRAGMLVAGMLTDKNVYREVLAVFYTVTKIVEKKVYESKTDIATKLQSLEYSFTAGYEKDLANLYTPDTWEKEVAAVVARNPAAKAYVKTVENIDAETNPAELVGAVQVLWGALVVGGSAMAYPKIKKNFGDDVVHLFEGVVGPGRAQRKEALVKVWDSLATRGSADFDKITVFAREYMERNNLIFSTLQVQAWWLKWLKNTGVALATAVGVVGLAFAFGGFSSTETTAMSK